MRESSDDSRRSAKAPESFVDRASKAVSRSFTPGSGSSSFNEENKAEDEKELQKRLNEIKAIAKRLEGPVQKSPRSGKGMFKKMQDRYVAVVKGEDCETTTGFGTNVEIALWKGGQLAYWEDGPSFRQGSAPKGNVILLKIAKVWVNKDDARGREVVVKHKRGDEMQELVLSFRTKRDAEEWSYALWEFISKLRGHSSGSMYVGMD